MIDRDFLRGFVKIYTLWRAGQQEVYGSQIAEEMKPLGFELSPGTLYPALHGLLRERDVTVRERIVDGKRRKCYRVTAKGRRELAELQDRLAVLMRKVFSQGTAGVASRKSAAKKWRP
jgi:PadR family transcriptional regulator, regulatory protein PadR